MPKPEKHVFLCAQGRPAGHPRGSCQERGCGPVGEEFWFQMQARNLLGRFAVTNTACFGPCGMGPNVLVYPEGVMYNAVTADDVKAIIDEHLLEGTVVSRLLAPEEVWG